MESSFGDVAFGANVTPAGQIGLVLRSVQVILKQVFVGNIDAAYFASCSCASPLCRDDLYEEGEGDIPLLASDGRSLACRHCNKTLFLNVFLWQRWSFYCRSQCWMRLLGECWFTHRL